MLYKLIEVVFCTSLKTIREDKPQSWKTNQIAQYSDYVEKVTKVPKCPILV